MNKMIGIGYNSLASERLVSSENPEYRWKKHGNLYVDANGPDFFGQWIGQIVSASDHSILSQSKHSIHHLEAALVQKAQRYLIACILH